MLSRTHPVNGSELQEALSLDAAHRDVTLLRLSAGARVVSVPAVARSASARRQVRRPAPGGRTGLRTCCWSVGGRAVAHRLHAWHGAYRLRVLAVLVLARRAVKDREHQQENGADEWTALTDEGLRTGTVHLPRRPVHVGVWLRLLRTLLDEVATGSTRMTPSKANELQRIWREAGHLFRDGLGQWKPYETLGWPRQ